MPLPTTRNAGGDVGSSREYRPGVAPCSHAKVGGTVRCGEPPARTIGYAAATYFRRPDVPTIPGQAPAASCARPSHGPHPRQCALSPCSIAAPFSCRAAGRGASRLLAPLQPRLESDRARLETGAKAGHSQPVLSQARKLDRGSKRTDGCLEKAKFGFAETMLHYLRRSVYH